MRNINCKVTYNGEQMFWGDTWVSTGESDLISSVGVVVVVVRVTVKFCHGTGNCPILIFWVGDEQW